MTQQLMKAMRYHQFGGPEVLTLEHISRPVPQHGEILVRVHSAGVLPIDWKIRQRLFPIPIQLPHIPGSSFAGVVGEAGPGVTLFHKGQPVFGRTENGSYAEFTTVRADSVALLPEMVSFDEAAAISGGATTAWQALFPFARGRPCSRTQPARTRSRSNRAPNRGLTRYLTILKGCMR